MITLLAHRWGAVLLLALAAGIASILSARRDRVVILLACCALGAHAALYWAFTVDDSFITFRFARSWIEGVGPVFQPGPHVEGITSFGWMALIALAGLLGAHLEVAAKVMGVIAAAATLPATHALALRMTGRPRLAAAATLLLALNPLFAAWAVAGMDTPLFAALVTWGVWARMANKRVLGLPLDAMLFGLSVWIRPEGFLLGTLAWLTLAAQRRAGTWRDALRWALVATAFAAPFWAWRWSYYGSFFPNTFYAKMPDLHVRATAGLLSLRDFAVETGPWIWVPLAASLFRLRVARAPERLPWLLLVAFLAYVAWSGGDVLHLRFYVHVLPLVMALWTSGLAWLLGPWTRAAVPAPATKRGRRVPIVARLPVPVALRIVMASALVSGGCALGAARYARATGSHKQFGPGYVVNNARNVHEVNLPLGEWLRANAPSGSQLATWDIGGIGWTSRLPILDLYGLTDPVIAHLIHDRAPMARRIEYVMAARPELFVTYARADGPDWSWLAPATDSIMANYRFHSMWQATTSGYWLVLLTRNDVRLPRVGNGQAAEPAER